MGTHPIFESDFDCLTEMRILKYGVLAGLISAENFGTVKSDEAKEAQEAVKKMREGAMKEATAHIADLNPEELKELENQHLKDALRRQQENLASQGVKHAKEEVTKEKIAQMKMRAAHGCPHAAEFLKNLEAEKVKKKINPPIEDRVLGSRVEDEEYTVQELRELAAKGNGLAQLKLQELAEENLEAEVAQLKAAAAQGCPRAKA